MNYVISNNLSLKYQKLTSIGFKDIGIRNFEFVKTTQFLSDNNDKNNEFINEI